MKILYKKRKHRTLNKKEKRTAISRGPISNYGIRGKEKCDFGNSAIYFGAKTFRRIFEAPMLSLDRKLRNLPGEFAGYLSRLSIRIHAVFASFILFFYVTCKQLRCKPRLGAEEKNARRIFCRYYYRKRVNLRVIRE